ncbi:TAXI family TRAP transporter solute-binding subunit, partial [Limnobacter sp.]|uniref:TAXI family TRAP transporter solute-binding subunit n=1 Tax=Limnobacter sp. TaxID=2003368 RepID=UPI002733828F
LVHTGKLAFGMTTMGPARDALDGKSPLAPGLKMNKVCAMFPMYQTPFSVTVLSSSGIKSIKDIPAGSKIGFGPAGSTSDTYFPKMLETLGVKFERRNGGWSDLGGQLQDGLIDVVAFAAGVPIPAVTQLEVQTKINILEFTEAEQKKIIDTYPVSAFPIKADTYKTLTKDARAVSMWNYTIANCDLPESFVYEATKAVLDNNPKMLTIHKGARTTLAENWDKNTFIPFHPGAVKYYEEKGFKIPANLKMK